MTSPRQQANKVNQGISDFERVMARTLSNQEATAEIVSNIDFPKNLINPDRLNRFFELLAKRLREELTQLVAGMFYGLVGRGGENKEYWPWAIAYDIETDADGERRKIKRKEYPFPARPGTRSSMDEGFRELGKVLQTSRHIISEKAVEIIIGPGEQLTELKLNEFMGHSGKSEASLQFNSLWRSVLWGTGISENVAAGVRTSGPTKFKDPPGSWWLGVPRSVTRVGETLPGRDDPYYWVGVHFLGQKGITVDRHFLYEPRNSPGPGVLRPEVFDEVRRLATNAFLELAKGFEKELDIIAV